MKKGTGGLKFTNCGEDAGSRGFPRPRREVPRFNRRYVTRLRSTIKATWSSWGSEKRETLRISAWIKGQSLLTTC